MNEKGFIMLGCSLLVIVSAIIIGMKTIATRSHEDVSVAESNSSVATPAPSDSTNVERNDEQTDDNAVVWGVIDNSAVPSDDAVKAINSILKSEGYSYSVKFKAIKSYKNSEDMEKNNSDIDIARTVCSLTNNNASCDLIRDGYFMNLDDYLSGDGKDLYNDYDKMQWDSVKVDGSIYTLPNTYYSSLGTVYYFNSKYISKNDLKSFDGTLNSLGKILDDVDTEEIKSPLINLIYGEMECGSWLSGGSASMGMYYSDESQSADIWFKSDEVYNMYKKLNEFYEKGYISSENSMLEMNTSYSDLVNMVNKGEYVVCAASQSILQAQNIDIGDAISYQTDFSMNSTVGTSMGVADNSKHKKNALSFLKLAYSNNDIANLMIYGKVGMGYSIKDGVVSDYVSDGEFCDQVIHRQIEFGNYEMASPFDTENIKSRKNSISNLIKNHGVSSCFAGFEPDVTKYEDTIGNLLTQFMDDSDYDIWKSSDFESDYSKLLNSLNTETNNAYTEAANKQIKVWKNND